jgi:hypothetical protein
MDPATQPAPSVTADPLDGAIWRKSSFSGTQGNCVEVATNLPGPVAVRDSKDPTGPTITVTRDEWAGFVRVVKQGGIAVN